MFAYTCKHCGKSPRLLNPQGICPDCYFKEHPELEAKILDIVHFDDNNKHSNTNVVEKN